MRVDDGLVQYLLSRGRRDLNSLMAVLDSLDRATLERQRPATLPLLKEVMQLQLEQDESRR
jgi:DnaA family protein